MTKVVHLSERAYRTLRGLKRESESFSDVVLRVVASRKDPRLLKGLTGWRSGPTWEDVRAQSDRIDRQRIRDRLGQDVRGPSGEE